MKKLFEGEPKADWIVTPTRIVVRKEFFAVKTASTGTHATERVTANPS